jgi:hypothetical protein
MSTPQSVENSPNPLIPLARITENSWPNSYGQSRTIKDVSKVKQSPAQPAGLFLFNPNRKSVVKSTHSRATVTNSAT